MGTLAIAIALVVAGPAHAATAYPSGGSDFVGDQQGWAGSDTACTGGVGSVCSTSTVYEPATGNPAGSISMRMAATAHLGGVFIGAGTWTSPVHRAGRPGGHGATFSYERQLAAGGLLSLAPESTVTVKLVDVTSSTTTTLLNEVLTTADSSFATRGAGAPAAAFVDGHSYRLRIETSTTTTTASLGVVGQENTRFDNVVLAVEQATGGGGLEGGGTTPIVSEGVTVVKGFRSDTEIASLFRRFNETTEVGHGPGAR